MFETAELGQKVDAKSYKKQVPPLREQLLRLQDAVHRAGCTQVILLLGGVDGGGKGESISKLNEWMDPRWMVTRAYEPPDEHERRFPEYWRYWRDLPPRGRIGMFLSAWYSQPILDRVYDRISAHEFEAKLDRILSFETALAEDGAAIVKFWMHLSEQAQERRLKNLEQDPLTEAQVSESDWENWRHYERFVETAEHVISRTHTGKAPWVIVEGEDTHYRCLTVGYAVKELLVRIQDGPSEPLPTPPVPAGNTNKPKKSRAKKADNKSVKAATVLSQLDTDQTLGKAVYAEQLKHLQARLLLLQNAARTQGVATVLVFEGWDAAGKGGVIRRIDAALEARVYQVHGVAKPTEEELAQHYLWRFWRNLPRDGHMGIFDRSWYGRVLVERVEGFAQEHEWRRAYAEINDFESQLVDHGINLIKYWIHITKDEQLRRFKLRERTPHKRWKLTDEDWRNREKWEDYELAVHDMVQYTSTKKTPWTLVEGNDKRFARIKVLRTLCDRLADKVGEQSGTDCP